MPQHSHASGKELLHFVGVNLGIVEAHTTTTGLGARVEMDSYAGLVTKSTAAISQIPTVSCTGEELHRFAGPVATIVAQAIRA